MSIGSSQPFRPAGTVSLAARTSSANVALAGGGESLLVTNASGSVAFVRLGNDKTVTATTSDTPVLPSTCILLGVNPLITTAAAVLASGTGDVYFTLGDGSSI